MRAGPILGVLTILTGPTLAQDVQFDPALRLQRQRAVDVAADTALCLRGITLAYLKQGRRDREWLAQTAKTMCGQSLRQIMPTLDRLPSAARSPESIERILLDMAYIAVDEVVREGRYP